MLTKLAAVQMSLGHKWSHVAKRPVVGQRRRATRAFRLSSGDVKSEH